MLDRAILRITTGTQQNPSTGSTVSSEEGIPAVYSAALQRATQQVIHEVRPVLQSIDRAARFELDDGYAGGRTEAAVNRLDGLLGALQKLGEAAESPRISQFDISELIASQVGMEGFTENAVSFARSDAMLVSGDPSLVTLGVINIVRNAVEASEGTEKPVVINWGRNDRDAWVSVLDEGEGLPDDGLAGAFIVGSTSRRGSGHFGLGLPTAEQALNSMGGTISLKPRREGGTSAEARWPQ